MKRTNALLDSGGTFSNVDNIGAMKKPDKQKWDKIKKRALTKKGLWNDELEQTMTEETKMDPEALDVHPEDGDITAERFDFTLMSVFYSHNISVDEFGERIISINDEIGRVVSKEGIKMDDDELAIEEEEEIVIGGRTVSKKIISAPIIPVT